MQKTGGKSDICAEIKRSNARLEELNQELEEIRTFQLMTSDGSTSFPTPARQSGTDIHPFLQVYSHYGNYLRRRRRLCFWFGLFVCLSVCLSVRLLANLWTDFDEIFWRGRAWLKDQVIQFWWRSGSRFGSGSPKSKIQILWIGGGLCSLSTSSCQSTS